MEKKYFDLNSKDDTIRQMKRVINSYYTDLLPFKDWSVNKFYNHIRSYPYKQDSYGTEELRRPKYFTLKPHADCKKKAIMIASFLKLKDIPYRLTTSSSRSDKNVHHVFVQFQDKNGDWINIDATYPSYYIGQVKKVTNFIIEGK